MKRPSIKLSVIDYFIPSEGTIIGFPPPFRLLDLAVGLVKPAPIVLPFSPHSFRSCGTDYHAVPVRSGDDNNRDDNNRDDE